ATREELEADLTAELYALRARTDALAGQLHAAEARAAAAEEALAALRHAASGDEVGRVLAETRRLDTAASVLEILDALAEAVAARAARSAILVASEHGFTPWRLTGFEAAAGRPISRDEATRLELGLPAAPPPAEGEALVVRLDLEGRVVALVYADRGAMPAAEPAPPGWREAVELLGRHAAARLAAVTAIRTVRALELASTRPPHPPYAPVRVRATTGLVPPPASGRAE
ncbi:MAG TPA: hypothetical protein VNI83_05195, partial [Vicinamibacterales bacterium]|nr:hypothetical protein [Vicinamibacterales bacterium]